MYTEPDAADCAENVLSDPSDEYAEVHVSVDALSPVDIDIEFAYLPVRQSVPDCAAVEWDLYVEANPDEW
jgi:hypothetical protein